MPHRNRLLQPRAGCRTCYTPSPVGGGSAVDSGRERLFILTLCFSLAMTLIFAGALVYDVTSNRDSAATSTLIHTGGTSTGDAGPTDQPGAGPPAPSTSGAGAGPVGSNRTRPSARAAAA